MTRSLSDVAFFELMSIWLRIFPADGFLYKNTLICSSFASLHLRRKLLMLLRWSPCNCITSPYSGWSTTVPLQANSYNQYKLSQPVKQSNHVTHTHHVTFLLWNRHIPPIWRFLGTNFPWYYPKRNRILNMIVAISTTILPLNRKL